jgi:5,10-methylenetetrahydrofolate reductase
MTASAADQGWSADDRPGAQARGRVGCPKHMVYGPCGGVREPDRCEVDDHPCPFVDSPVVSWRGTPAHSRLEPWPPAGEDRAVILTDLRVRPFDLDSIAAVTRRLAVDSDCLLIGEHQNRPDFPPSFAAQAVADAGGHPWVTLTCRDRNRVVLEAELEALVASPVAGVHCVTGDARAPSVRADASQVFDLDGVRLAALARARGLIVSVAATPAAPPRALRPLRLLQKQRAGADLCIVNHAGGPGPVRDFVAACRALGVTMPFLPCVAVFTDARSAAVLQGFPGLVLEPDERRQVLTAADPREAGIRAAVAQAREMLAIPGVAGVNLSGSATSGPEEESAAIMAEVAARVRAAA